MLVIKVHQLGSAVATAARPMIRQHAALLGLQHGADVDHGLHHALACRIAPGRHAGALGLEGRRIDPIGRPGGQHGLAARPPLLARGAQVISGSAGDTANVGTLLGSGLDEFEGTVLPPTHQHHHRACAQAHHAASSGLTFAMAMTTRAAGLHAGMHARPPAGTLGHGAAG
jgi:hypothetical protein